MIKSFTRILFFLLIAVPVLKAQGQSYDSCSYKIEGTVYNRETGDVLPFASIQLKGTSKGTVANEEGYFYLNTICEEEFDLVFSHIGFKSVVHHHDVHHKLPKIFLAPADVTLQSVIIEGEVAVGELNSGTVSRISAEELSRHNSSSLGEVVGRISGVSLVKSGQNVVKPVIHGLHSNRILIVNNGVRHEYQSWGQDHAPELDPGLADNIQVIKGAATVRYGPDALGGVILINPPKMELLTDIEGDVELIGKSNGRAIAGNARIQKGFHKVAFLAEGGYTLQGDLKAPDYFLTNTGKREGSIALGTRYHIKKWDLTGNYSHFQQELGILRGSVTGSLEDLENAIGSEPPENTGPFDYTIANPRQVVRHNLMKINGSYNQEHSIWNFQYAFQSNKRQEFDIRRGTNNDRPSIDLDLYSHTLDVDWKHPEFKDWIGTVGIQGLYQDNNNNPGTNTAPFIPNFNNYRLGAFIIESKQINNLLFEWGIRYDFMFSSVRGRQQNNDIYSNELTFHNITATAGVEKKLSNNSIFRSNIGTAWRPPSVSELYSFGKHQASIEYGLLRYDFSPTGFLNVDEILTEEEKDVEAEKGIKWINTLTYTNNKWNAEFTGFINYIENYIYTQPAGITQTIRGAFPYYIYRQTDAMLAGIDISVLHNHTRRLSSHIKGSYLWAEDIINDSYFIGLPPAQISYEVNYHFSNVMIFKKVVASVDLDYTFSPFYNPEVISTQEIRVAKENGIELFTENSSPFDLMDAPGNYLIVNFIVQTGIKKWTLLFKADNIFDVEYRSYTDRIRYFADDLGRNLILSVKYSF